MKYFWGLFTVLSLMLITCLAPVTAKSSGINNSRNVENMAARAMESVVSILAVSSSTSGDSGTGFFISGDGHILTNFHVIQNGQTFIIQGMDKTIYRNAHVVGVDPMTDLAVLKLESPGPFPALVFADSDQARPGQPVCAIGHGNSHRNAFTMGVVSARRNQLPDFMTQGLGITYVDLIQTDVSINHGNSGGPLLNLAGECVGVNSAIDINVETGDASWQGISYSIAGNLAKKVADRIIRDGFVERVSFGIGGQDITPDLKRAFKAPKEVKGVLVSSVGKDSPADLAGLLAGDILLSVDGVPVNNAQRTRINAAFLPPGKPVPMEIFRLGEKKKITITPRVVMVPEPVTIERMGIMVDPEPVSFDSTGVLIVDIHINSPFFYVDTFSEHKGAGGFGINPKEKILEFNHSVIKSHKDLQRAINQVKPGELVLMLVKGKNSELRYVAGNLP